MSIGNYSISVTSQIVNTPLAQAIKAVYNMATFIYIYSEDHLLIPMCSEVLINITGIILSHLTNLLIEIQEST